MNPQQVIRDICRVQGVAYQRFMSMARDRHVANARSIASLVLRMRFQMSYPCLAEQMRFATHTSALHHCQRAKASSFLMEQVRRHLGWIMADALAAELAPMSDDETTAIAEAAGL